MARSLVRASSQYLEYAGCPVSNFPFTLSCFFYDATSTQPCGIFGIWNVSGTFVMSLGGTQSNHLNMYKASNQMDTLNTTTAVSSNVWNHAGLVVTNGSSRAIYLNGGGKNTATGLTLFSGSMTTSIGRQNSNAQASYFNGRVAEPAIWNAALTDDEILILSLGVSPLLVRPANLVGYWPLLGTTSPEIDLMGGRNMTVTGATLVDHCRMYTPNNSNYIEYDGIGGGGIIDDFPGLPRHILNILLRR